MKFDLPEFLDSLKGLTRGAAARLIQDEMDELNKFNRRPRPSSGGGGGIAAVRFRVYTREYDFLENLLYDVKTGGRSEIKKVDREEIDEVLKSLKLEVPVKIIKKTTS